MLLFVKYQPNKHRCGDCVVRALTKAENLTWIEAYDVLCNVGRRLQCMPNDKATYEDLLKTLGYKKISIKPVKGSTRGTVQEWAEKHPTGTFVLSVSNHLVCVKDGHYYDSWDCGFKSLYTVWEK